jgi:hypothetical protein
MLLTVGHRLGPPGGAVPVLGQWRVLVFADSSPGRCFAATIPVGPSAADG